MIELDRTSRYLIVLNALRRRR